MTPQNLSAPGNGAQPLVSIIMNCLDSEKYLREAIDSVYAQTYSNWEIIFWDNASRDASADIARSYGDGRLRYFRGETTVPLGHARNLAIRQSRGEFIAFLDCDDLWMPAKLEKQVPLFLLDREVGLVYSDTYFFNDSGSEKRLYSDKMPYRGHRFGDLLNNYLISLETAVLRKTALDSLDHWFDEKFNMVEEFDLFVRIGLDWKVDFVPEVLAKWRVHGDSWSWKFPDSFVLERRVMLEKLQTLPKINLEHARGMKEAWSEQILLEARVLWKKGDGSAARKIIGDIPNRRIKSYLVWMATFLPYSSVRSIYRSVFALITPS